MLVDPTGSMFLSFLGAVKCVDKSVFIPPCSVGSVLFFLLRLLLLCTLRRLNREIKFAVGM